MLLILACLSIAAALHCGKSNGTPAEPGGAKMHPSFTGDVQPIFDSTSATSSSCHQAPGQQSLTLSAGQSYALLVNVNSTEVPVLKRVRPSKIDSSYVVNKLDGTQTVGSKAPLTGSISSPNVTLIKDWITKGAANNRRLPYPDREAP